MDIIYRGITVEIRSIPVVTPQQATPSPWYYCKFHLQNRGIPAVTAVLPPSPLPRRALVITQMAALHHLGNISKSTKL